MRREDCSSGSPRCIESIPGRGAGALGAVLQGKPVSDSSKMERRQRHALIVLWVNFLLFMVLFAGLGFLILQSVALVGGLREDLANAQAAVAEMQARLQNMDPEEVIQRLLTSATDQLDEAIRSSVAESDLGETMEAIQGISESLEGLNPQELADLVAVSILLGLSDAFADAAESRGADPAR